MESLASFLMHRVDAARKRMWVPAQAAEGSGRLFLAKRCHEAVKAGQDLAAALPTLVAEVKASLGEATHDGVDAEADAISRRLGPGAGGVV